MKKILFIVLIIHFIIFSFDINVVLSSNAIIDSSMNCNNNRAVNFTKTKKYINNNRQELKAYFSYESTCLNDSTIFTNESTGDDITTLHWFFGDGIDTWNFPTPYHIYQEAITYNVTLVITTKSGQTDSYSRPVTIHPIPPIDLDFDGDTILYEGQDVNIHVNGSFHSYIWSTGEIQDNITVNSSGAYTVEVINEDGCSNTKTTQITVNSYSSVETLQIEVENNILTPNDDGVNDRLIIIDCENFISQCNVVIYNVWGQLVYSNSDYCNSAGWDGNRNGKLHDAGTYYYVIKSEGRKSQVGYIDLIR